MQQRNGGHLVLPDGDRAAPMSSGARAVRADRSTAGPSGAGLTRPVAGVTIVEMSWEAFRLTSKSPSELYDVLGPEGVDNLLRQFLTACWNALPMGERSMEGWRRLVQNVFDRN